MVFVITSLIGGFGTVHVIWLANVTVRLQPIVRLHCPITTLLVKDEAVNAPTKFEEIVLVVINDEIARVRSFTRLSRVTHRLLPYTPGVFTADGLWVTFCGVKWRLHGRFEQKRWESFWQRCEWPQGSVLLPTISDSYDRWTPLIG